MRQYILAATVVVWAAGALPARAATIFYPNDLAGFAAAMAGRTLLGFEDFEGSTQGPLVVTHVIDPLTQGVPNGPYPAGLSAPLTVQSNLLGGNPATTSPGDGLAAISAGIDGVLSDAVVANNRSDSLDLIFAAADQVSGVGFNTINIFFDPPGRIDVRVYDIVNNLLGTTTIDAEQTGANFLGIATTAGEEIGRINLHSLGGTGQGGAGTAFEGADNVAIYAGTVPEPGSLALLLMGLAGCRRALRPKA